MNSGGAFYYLAKNYYYSVCFLKHQKYIKQTHLFCMLFVNVSITMNEKNKIHVSQNEVLMEIFWSNRNEVNGQFTVFATWICVSKTDSLILQVTKSQPGDVRTAYRILVVQDRAEEREGNGGSNIKTDATKTNLRGWKVARIGLWWRATALALHISRVLLVGG